MKNESKGFDSLPDQVSAIYSKMERIEKLLNHHPSFKEEVKDEFLTIEQAAEFIHLARQTLYGLVCDRKIPYIKRKGSKRLYFSRNELREWIIGGRKKTSSKQISGNKLNY